ncbi:Pyruvate decarboxylase 1 [Ascosphaera acerosa]|nr:Pyruvate decarboxylase 1 [Ascosphaera acerosa]
MSANTIEMNAIKEPVDVGTYLLRRLYEVGIRSVHGLPGDYNLRFLDYLEKENLKWVGNVNELNASYAADAYGRVKGMGCIVTTFGVGELSAVNGLAGAYSEYVPVVHIVGAPNTTAQKNGALLHHTLGNGDFTVFYKMSEGISCYSANLNDPHKAAVQIDTAIRECWIKSRPVYLMLPTDMVTKPVDGSRLHTPLDLSVPANDPEAEQYVVDVVMRSLEKAKNPAILVDACAIRFRCLKEVNDLVKKSGFPTFVAPMGKGAVDETLPNFGGTYAGVGSAEGVCEALESSDLVLHIGGIKSDFNTSGFTYRTTQMNTIDFHSTSCRVRYSEYPNVGMKSVLARITERMGDMNVKWESKLANIIPKDKKTSMSPVITHHWLWPAIGQWLRENDVVITETGTANFGIWETRFPRGVQNISQVLWGSIGYSVGACQGAVLAARDIVEDGGLARRTILFVGDGSLQLTVQEISTMIRRKLCPIIFIICNNGYTIERFIHGWEAEYNDIQPWRHLDLAKQFGAEDGSFRTYSVKTKTELLNLCKDEQFSSADVLQLVELHMPQDDCPRSLKLTCEAAAKLNRQE